MIGPRKRSPWQSLKRRLRRRLVRAGRVLGLVPPKPAPDRLDLLFGHVAIARFMGLSKNQARALIQRRAIPSFVLDGVTCARKSSIASHIMTLEAEHGQCR